jgi:hypothetical protein
MFSCNGKLLDDVKDEWIPAMDGSQILPSTPSCNQTFNHEDNFPLTLLQHHSVREIQVLSLHFDYHREKQLINITGITTGEYVLVLQGLSTTVNIPTTASASVISNALSTAALKIDSKKRECSSFSVGIRKGTNSLELTVEFLVDNSSPLSILEGYSISLQGESVDYTCILFHSMSLGPHPSIVVSILQQHTPLPSSTFDLIYEDHQPVAIPYDASVNTFESLFETAFSDSEFNVLIQSSLSLPRSHALL